MNKTPEELSEQAIKWMKTLPTASERCNQCACEGYRAGYEAAKKEEQLKLSEIYSHGSDVQKIASAYLKSKGIGGALLPYAENRFIDGYLVAMNSSNNSNGWISVKDRLPEIDQWCSWWDLSGATEPCTAFRSVDDIELWWENYTHWMPLPEAPKEEA